MNTAITGYSGSCHARIGKSLFDRLALLLRPRLRRVVGVEGQPVRPTSGVMMRFPSLVFIVIPLALSACASPRSQLESGLRQAGMGKSMARCMSGEMSDDLSLGQLIKLSKLSQFQKTPMARMPMEQFLKATRSLQDPEILKIASAAALICAIR